MKASRAANDEARPVELPKHKLLIKTIEGLTQNQEPDEMQTERHALTAVINPDDGQVFI